VTISMNTLPGGNSR